MKKKASNLWKWQQWCKDGLHDCPCGEKRDLTVDHIIPGLLVKQFMIPDLTEYDMLYTYEENFEILCHYCNRRKGGMLDVRNPKTFELLKKLVAQSQAYHEKKDRG